jgi:peroxiredoxin (alkyl hydroperoxide reductase subunit C)
MSESTSSLRVGQPVPNFEIKTYDPVRKDFGSFKLADARAAGRWTVLFFYPADFTFVCASEFAALAVAQDEFTALGADVVTVSTDTPYVHLAWQRDERSLERARFAMGADPTGAVSRLFGVYDPATGLALRGTFLVSPEGMLTNAEVNFYNLGRNVDEILRKVRANRYLAAHGDEACPASWAAEGDRTLRPSAKLVGHVHEALEE